jgi:hypothetical protein
VGIAPRLELLDSPRFRTDQTLDLNLHLAIKGSDLVRLGEVAFAAKDLDVSFVVAASLHF